jgi:hypothetical protein
MKKQTNAYLIYIHIPSNSEHYIKDEGTPKKLATATQPQLQRNVTDFEHATGFRISRRTLRKLIFDSLLTSSQVGVFIRLTA